MRILFVCPWVPSLIRPRALGLLRMLSRDHEVHVLAAAHSPAEAAAAQGLPAHATTTVPVARSRAVLRCLRGLASSRSLQTCYMDDPALVRAFVELRDRWQPDVVHLNVLRTAQLHRLLDPRRLVVDLDELRSDYYRQLAQRAPSPQARLLGRVEAPRMARLEQQLIALGAPLLFSSPSDLGRAGPTAHLVRSPHSIAPPSDGVRADGQLLFAGRLDYSANVSAVESFVQDVLPLVRERDPRARLLVVGSRPTARVRRLAGEHVQVVSDVPDLSPYYAQAAVSVVPLRTATGVQMKLIESLWCATPTVTTQECADRAGVVDGEHVLTAGEPAQWADQVCRLLAGGEQVDALGAAGQRWASQNYGEAAISASLAAAYAMVAGG